MKIRSAKLFIVFMLSVLNATAEISNRHSSDTSSPKTRSKYTYPSWLSQDYNSIATYVRRIRENPAPKKVDYTAIGLSDTYSRLRNELEKSVWELETMFAVGVENAPLDTEMKRAIMLSDSIHKEWALWLSGNKESKLNTPELKTRYKKDLEVFGDVGLAFRYNVLWNEAFDKSGKTPSIKEEKKLRQNAANALYEELTTTPALKRFTLERLTELSAETPELKNFILGKQIESVLPKSWFKF